VELTDPAAHVCIPVIPEVTNPEVADMPDADTPDADIPFCVVIILPVSTGLVDVIGDAVVADSVFDVPLFCSYRYPTEYGPLSVTLLHFFADGEKRESSNSNPDFCISGRLINSS
jgi:hypothetical protein